MNNNKMNLVPSSDDDRDWILDAYYIGYYKKNWLNPKIEYELPPRVILKCNFNPSIDCKSEDLKNLNIEITVNIIKEWFNFQYFHNKFNLSSKLNLIKTIDIDNIDINNIDINIDNIDISSRTVLKKINKFNGVDEYITSNNNKKLLNYCRIYSIETLKKSLIDNGVGLIILPYYTKNFKSNFWISDKNNSNNFIGCISLIVIGYNDKGFIIINNNKDEYLFPYIDWGIQCEIWSILHYTI